MIKRGINLYKSIYTSPELPKSAHSEVWNIWQTWRQREPAKLPTFPDGRERRTFFLLQPYHLQGYQLPIHSTRNQRKDAKSKYACACCGLIGLPSSLYFVHVGNENVSDSVTQHSKTISVRLGSLHHHRNIHILSVHTSKGQDWIKGFIFVIPCASFRMKPTLNKITMPDNYSQLKIKQSK